MFDDLETLLKGLGISGPFIVGDTKTWSQVIKTPEGQSCSDAVLAFEHEDMITASVIERQSGEPVSVVSFDAELRDGRWHIRSRDDAPQDSNEPVHRFREAVAGMTPDSH